MAFRADEAARMGYESVEQYFTRSANFDAEQKAHSKASLRQLVEDANLGSVVSCYPSWHPLVSHHTSRHIIMNPGRDCGYRGLDHNAWFVNGFITCPYGDGEDVIQSVEEINEKHHKAVAWIRAEKLDFKLYHPEATPILVRCSLAHDLLEDGTIPSSLAVRLMLEKELPCAMWSQVAETWESMRHCFLGGPHGKRSSLFVNQETGQKMKKAWEAVIQADVFGPIKD